MKLEFWQMIALYGLIAAMVTFLITLFFGDLDDNPPPALIGFFWPFILMLVILFSPIFGMMKLQDLALRFHKLTDTGDSHEPPVYPPFQPQAQAGPAPGRNDQRAPGLAGRPGTQGVRQ